MNNYIVTMRFNAHHVAEEWTGADIRQEFFPYEGEATASVSAETEERAKELALGYYFEDHMTGQLDGAPVVDKVILDGESDDVPEEVWDFEIKEPELEELY